MTSGRGLTRDRRPTLAQHIVFGTTAVVLVAAVVTVVVGVGLVGSASNREARLALGRHADVVVSLLNAGRPDNIDNALRARRGETVPIAHVLADGTMTGDALARQVMAQNTKELLAGRTQSFETRAAGRLVIVESRPLRTGGGIVLARSRPSAVVATLSLLGPQLIALGVGVAAAVAAAALIARWLARPLRHAADAAARLAGGDREVRLDPVGPREVAQVAESVNVLAAALQGSEARQREFLLSVSHELRTPLTGIRGFAESLADEVITEPAQVRGAGRTIVAESLRLERLVGDLLDLARLGADDFRLDLTDFDLRDLLDNAARVWASRCAAEGVRFAVELPADPVWVRADAARVRQILDGLAENALRVTPAGRPLVLGLRVVDGAPPRGTEQEGADVPEGAAVVQGAVLLEESAVPVGAALLEVRDGGPGLSAADREVAFERSALYDRYRGVRRVGTGLGLALVKGLVLRLGGRVAVTSAREGGACFQVVFPLLTTDL